MHTLLHGLAAFCVLLSYPTPGHTQEAHVVELNLAQQPSGGEIEASFSPDGAFRVHIINRVPTLPYTFSTPDDTMEIPALRFPALGPRTLGSRPCEDVTTLLQAALSDAATEVEVAQAALSARAEAARTCTPEERDRIESIIAQTATHSSLPIVLSAGGHFVARVMRAQGPKPLTWTVVVRTPSPQRPTEVPAEKGIRPVHDPVPIGELFSFDGSYALLIGASRYTQGWPNLPAVPQELEEIAAALKRKGFTITTLEDPDGDQLREALQGFINLHGYQANNRLLFFFSGHGHSRNHGTKGYLVPVDAPNPDVDEIGFLQKALTMDDIQTWARKMEARHALFLFDSCFAGTVFAVRALPRDAPQIAHYMSRPVRQFITAGGADEPVPARSVFAPSLVRAIQGEADLNGDNWVTGTELGMHLTERVMHYRTGQTPQYGKIRDPELDRGDFVFQLEEHGESPSVSVRPTLTPSTERHSPTSVPVDRSSASPRVYTGTGRAVISYQWDQERERVQPPREELERRAVEVAKLHALDEISKQMKVDVTSLRQVMSGRLTTESLRSESGTVFEDLTYLEPEVAGDLVTVEVRATVKQ